MEGEREVSVLVVSFAIVTFSCYCVRISNPFVLFYLSYCSFLLSFQVMSLRVVKRQKCKCDSVDVKKEISLVFGWLGSCSLLSLFA